jgi:hypothetical protein
MIRPCIPGHLPAALICALLFGGFWTPPAGAAEAYLTLSEADCDRLARHYPSADATYQPGRDVRGKAVAPADLPAEEGGGSGLVLPEAVVIPIEIELFERYGIPANAANFKGDAYIGEVVVDVATGRAIFNGQPLQSEAEAELAALCQRIRHDAAAK